MPDDSSSRIDFAALRLLRKKHSAFSKLFVLSLVLLFGGLFLAFVIPPPVGTWLFWLPKTGFAISICLWVWSYPFGKTPCPRCGKPYYVPSGFWGHLCMVNLAYRKCIHCELPLDAKEEVVEQ